MARYSRERSRLGTLSGVPAGLSFLSPTFVMVHPKLRGRVARGMHLSLGSRVPNGADGGVLDRRSNEAPSQPGKACKLCVAGLDPILALSPTLQ
jgi:hypothetical protein